MEQTEIFEQAHSQGRGAFDRLLAQAKAVDMGDFDLRADIALALIAKYPPHLQLELAYDAFRIGFLKGQRCERTRMRRRAV